MTLFDLTGKTAVITGSSRGIGRAIAEEMARAGAKVVISSRKPEPCAEVAEAIRAAGGEAVAIPCHIGDKAQVTALIQAATKQFGGVDILVCNAAVNPYHGPLAGISDEAWDRVMASNVKSALWLANLALPGMAERHDGAVIFIASIAGSRASPGLGAYGTSKAALSQLARSLAAEWGGQNIRVNCIAPGLIKTDFAKALWENEELARKRIAATPLARLGDPIDIAGAAIFLAAAAGRYVTGQTITVDGGVTIA